MAEKDMEEKNGGNVSQDDMNQDEKITFNLDNEQLEANEAETEELAAFLELQQAHAELKDKQLRLLAEFENYKKRTSRERQDLLSYASKDTMLALLPVLDDFDRAKKSADDPNTDEKFSEGVTLVYNRLNTILQHLGLKEIESTGQPFDAEWHNAITEIPAPSPEMKGKVIDTIEKGYTLNDKIIRHAKVVVGQ